MSSDIVLTAALRNNLLSLQNTQRLIDDTQFRLATGLKVNSALDDPTAFFTAQSLNNRASDLSRLLDNINLSIRTIEEADAGITALTDLVEQAQSIVGSARDELAASEGEARLIGNVDLSSTGDLTTTSITTGDVLRIITTDDNGAQVAENVSIVTGDTAASFAAKITDQFSDNQNGEITAEVTSEGFLSIQSSDGRTFKLTTTAANELTNADLTALGINNAFEVETRTGGGTALNAATIVAGNELTSISLFENTGDLAEAGDLLGGTAYLDSDGNTVFQIAAGDTLNLIVNDGGTTRTTALIAGTSTFQDFVDSINQVNAVAANDVSQLIRAEFDSNTGQLSFTSLSDSVRNIQLVVTATANSVVDLGLGDPAGTLDPIAATGAGAEDFAFSFNSSTEALDAFAADYNVVRSQIDQLVVDANFLGVNLLNGDDLVTFFNENNTNSLTTSGVDFTAAGLSLTEASFRSSTEIELSATQTRDALGAVRAFGSSISNNLSIIQTRRDFTESTINTLTAGAGDLTVADQNEEGANLLALQTRQALGVTSLSLASQSQQSVLRLF